MKKTLASLCALTLALSLSASALASAGVSVKPRENEWNGVTWEDSSGPLARLTFLADSDPDAFYSKLSNDWSDSEYAPLFDDQDAYLFDFVGNPTVPATSVPTLVLYSPYVDEDGEPVSGKKVTVYRTDRGKLEDVTKAFVAGFDSEDRPILATGARVLGSYILAEQKVDAEKAAEFDEAIASKQADSAAGTSSQASAPKKKLVIRIPADD